ncbi:MAG: hypothetical protein OXF04_13470 [bacterium]|nr:hypothetical protein [bacterium]
MRIAFDSRVGGISAGLAPHRGILWTDLAQTGFKLHGFVWRELGASGIDETADTVNVGGVGFFESMNEGFERGLHHDLGIGADVEHPAVLRVVGILEVASRQGVALVAGRMKEWEKAVEGRPHATEPNNSTSPGSKASCSASAALRASPRVGMR